MHPNGRIADRLGSWSGTWAHEGITAAFCRKFLGRTG
jgi:hypothetical protein